MSHAKRIPPFRLRWMLLGLWLTVQGVAHAQIPGLPGTPSPPAQGARSKSAAAATAEKADATVATPSGPIVLEKPVKDSTIREALEHLLPKYPGVRSVQVEVDHGVVTLDGQVENEDVLEGVTQFTRRVEGVRLVLNRMQTDAQVLTAWRFGAQVLERTWKAISREWLLVVIAVIIFMAFLSLARLLASYSEKLLAPFITNVMLRSVAGSLMSTILVVAGLLLALSVLNLTHLVLSILGVAGMVGLAVGICLPRYHRELHRLDPARHAQAVPDRRLYPGRRASRRGQIAEHTRNRARHARRANRSESRTTSSTRKSWSTRRPRRPHRRRSTS